MNKILICDTREKKNKHILDLANLNSIEFLPSSSMNSSNLSDISQNSCSLKKEIKLYQIELHCSFVNVGLLYLVFTLGLNFGFLKSMPNSIILNLFAAS